jgi:1-phosphofructokinase family hexose kinase
MILCIGPAPTVQRTMDFDRVTIDAVNRARVVREYASGKSINVARVVRALGEKALSMGFAGGDRGAALLHDLDRAGIAHCFVEVEPQTRLCTTVIDRAAGTVTELVEESASVEPSCYERLVSLAESRLRQAKALVLSGSIPPGGPDDLYGRLARLATASGIPCIVDARGKPLLAAADAGATLCKPNLDELSATVGHVVDSDADVLDACRRLVDRGVRWVLVTHGRHPTRLSNGRSLWSIPVPMVKTVNPIGSGDSVAAGIAVGLARGLPMPEAAKLGVACGSANAMTELTAEVHVADVERLLHTMTLERVIAE